MEIKEPRYKVCDKVKFTNHPGIFEVVEMINFNFCVNDYFYLIKHVDSEEIFTINESNLEPYIEKPKTVWNLEEGDYYAIANISGEVSEIHWDGTAVEKSCRGFGNCFLTKEEAEFEVERRKIETEMLRLGGRRNIKIGKDNYYIMYDHKTGDFAYLIRNWIHEQGCIYFDSDIDAIDVVQEIGEDRIKKYIFGVNE